MNEDNVVAELLEGIRVAGGAVDRLTDTLLELERVLDPTDGPFDNATDAANRARIILNGALVGVPRTGRGDTDTEGRR